MNDSQRAVMIAELALLFDQAATSCSHAKQAALMIEQGLRRKGFAIVPKKVTGRHRSSVLRSEIATNGQGRA